MKPQLQKIHFPASKAAFWASKFLLGPEKGRAGRLETETRHRTCLKSEGYPARGLPMPHLGRPLRWARVPRSRGLAQSRGPAQMCPRGLTLSSCESGCSRLCCWMAMGGGSGTASAPSSPSSSPQLCMPDDDDLDSVPLLRPSFRALCK